MYWHLSRVDPPAEIPEPDGRFVLHAHNDELGPHLDLRLEQGGHLVGWRIEADRIEAECAATEKGPHPLLWLEHDGAALRQDHGRFSWLRRGDDAVELVLDGEKARIALRASRALSLPARCMAALATLLEEHSLAPEALVPLVRDGLTARARALARCCGLGRELDGEAFDAVAWRTLLSGRTLAEIQQHLHVFESRFDQKYPPLPVSQPAPLPDEETGSSTSRAMQILHL